VKSEEKVTDIRERNLGTRLLGDGGLRLERSESDVSNCVYLLAQEMERCTGDRVDRDAYDDSHQGFDE
jgi:hypothetical protein